MLSTAKLNATGIQWVSELADFNFKSRYRPGRIHRMQIDCPECQ